MRYLTESDYSQKMHTEVLPYLEVRKSNADFKGFDGNIIHAVKYTAENERAILVISHGFIESQIKYREMIYYFLNSGLTCYALDHRGHGKSYREISDTSVTHISKFSHYVDDFEIFINSVIKENKSAVPLYLYAHSMGGAIGIMNMQRHPDVFKKAVLSCPMIDPKTMGVPRILAKAISIAAASVAPKKRVFMYKSYSAPEPYEKGASSSRARYGYYADLRQKHRYLQNCAPTYAWVRESLKVRLCILKAGNVEKIKTKMLLFSAEFDDYVQEKPEIEFCKRAKNCEFIKVANTKHEIFGAEDSVLAPYCDRILNFY